MKSHVPQFILLTLLVSTLFAASLPAFTRRVYGNPDHSLEVRCDEDYYYVRGDTMVIEAYSNDTVWATLRVYWNWRTLTDDELVYQNTRECNATWNLPTGGQKPGFYKIEVSTSEHTVTTWRTLIHHTSYVPETLPFNHTWRGIEYTLEGRSLRAYNGETWFNITYPKIPFGHTTSFYRNNMTFLIRLHGATWDVDLLYFTTHSGLKWAINGTLDNPQSFEFKLENVGEWKRSLNRLRSGKHLVFDWSDLRKTGEVFQWNSTSKTLSVDIPSTFNIDPYIFEDGFESGLTPWSTGGTPTIETDPVHHGTNSCQINADNEYVWKDLGSEYSYLFARCYVQLTNDLGNNEASQVISFYSSGGGSRLRAGFYKQGSTPKVYYTDAPGWTTTNFDFTTGVWYCMEILYDSDSYNWTLWVDGTKYLEQTDVYDNDDVQRIYIGQVGSGPASPDLNYDCVVIDDEYIGVESEEAVHNLSGDVTQNTSTTHLLSWTFTREHEINPNFNILGEAVASVVQNLGGVIDQIFSVLTGGNAFTLDLDKPVTHLTTVNTLRGWGSTVLSTVTQVLTIEGSMDTSAVQNLYGNILHSLSVNSLLGWATTIPGTVGHVVTVDGTFTVLGQITNFYGEITQVLTLNSVRDYSSTVRSTIGQVFTVTTTNLFTLTTHGLLDPQWTVESTMTYTTAAVHNLAGVVDLVNDILSERSWAYTILPTVGQVWTVSGLADIFVSGQLDIMGVINLITQITGIGIFPVVDTNDQEIMLVAVAVLLPAVLAVGILVKRSIDKKGVEERGILDYI